MSYRTEIDGLRAAAVLFVLLFHFFPTKVPFGYLGVDLFFVISGYVITGHLASQNLNGSFSFTDFYLRRIKRILPLCFVVIATTLIAGSFILLQADFEGLTQSAFAAATFWANIHFWLDGGYFGGDDKLKPLLHMWSLSVEEQFYIFFPVLIWLSLRLSKTEEIGTIIVLFGLGLISLGLFLGLKHIGGDNPAFFLMPTRAWQFAAGAIAVLMFRKQWVLSNAILSAAGIAMLVFVVLYPAALDHKEIIITLAAAVYLVTTKGRFALDNLLSSAPMQYIGTRSFSMYLWHWPIVALLSYTHLGSIPLAQKLIGILATVLLSEASYRLVEQPFRRQFSLRSTILLLAGTVALSLAVAVATVSTRDDGLAERYASQAQSNFRCSLTDFRRYGGSRACILKPLSETGNVAILGNSHAQMYAPLITQNYKDHDAGVILIPLNSCLPTVLLNISERCQTQATQNLDILMDDNDVDTVFIGTNYQHRQYVLDGELVDATPDMLGTALLDLVAKLRTKKSTVYLIGPIQTPDGNLPSFLARGLKFNHLSEQEIVAGLKKPRAIFDENHGSLLQRLDADMGSYFLRPHLHLCDDSHCFVGDDQGIFFADTNHLGEYGLDQVEPVFSQLGPTEE